MSLCVTMRQEQAFEMRGDQRLLYLSVSSAWEGEVHSGKMSLSFLEVSIFDSSLEEEIVRCCISCSAYYLGYVNSYV